MPAEGSPPPTGRPSPTPEIAQCTAPGVCLPFTWVALGGGGRPTLITDLRTGRACDFEYDWKGRLVVARDALDSEQGWPGFRYEYGAFGGLLTASTNSEGERIEYEYVDRGKIRNVIQKGEGDPTHGFRYYAKNASGLYRTIHTNPIGGATRYLFDADRRLHARQLDHTGEVHTALWDADGSRRPTGEISASGATTTYTYAGDDLVSVVAPSGNAITVTYEPGGLDTDDPFLRAIRRVEDSVGLIALRTYDASGRPETAANGEGETTTTTYGPVTLSSITDPSGATRSFPQWGVHGHWLTMEGSFADKRSFDPVGNIVVPASIERIGGVLTRDYDGDRNVASIDVAATVDGGVVSEGVVSIERRSDGGVKSVRRPRGSDHEFVHDALGRVTLRRERVDGQWQSTVFAYDPAGNVTARSLPNGMREEFEYDPYGRLERRRALRDGALEGEAVFTRSAGNLVSVYDSIRDASESYGYDAAGRRTLIVFGYGESLKLEYDLRSRVEREIYSLPEAGIVRTIEYAYDLANRQVRVSTGAGEVLVERIFEAGRLVETRSGNGLIRTLGYDPDTGNFSDALTVDAQDAVVETTILTRTVESAPVRHQIRVTTDTPLGSTEEQYWLGVGGSLQDPDKLVGKRVFAWNDGNGAARTYAYDELSNPVSNVDGDVFTYNAEGNRLLSADLARAAASVVYTYDAAGFATSRDGVPITWTATGRMSSYGPIELEWDMLDRLVALDAGGVVRDFSLFGGRVESDPETGSLGALDLGDVSLPFSSPERLYRHLDFRGNVSFVSDANGEIVNHYQYHPYGVDAVLGSGQNEVTFVGRSGVGPFLLLGARMYDPLVGRFLSPDPVFSPLNQYAYTLGNPVWFSDPDGRESGGMLSGFDFEGADLIMKGVTVLVLIALGPSTVAATQVMIVLAIIFFLLAFGEMLAKNGLVTPVPNENDSFSGSFATPSAGSFFPAGVAPSPGLLYTTCSPVALSRVPRPRRLLGWILSLQLLLGMILLGRRRTRLGEVRC
jgi:RHS repeat-associated protein